ncbi:hypothetical protein [Beijerinckia indica]|uniref:Uncharacterized protein n=1 Tax=Beijerinckia indica subsp. indica (strain ATCC 9039 / DSM 1715 / NCIMB 8712) TaxID=395963 RepID=B2ICD3_BEII9|nr:hypothetical protein [Beijerinckia indica]ACB96730.1 hypothetical protein Bind_3169 [Beijerinckia indica subsp. indica ATCC 9039]
MFGKQPDREDLKVAQEKVFACEKALASGREALQRAQKRHALLGEEIEAARADDLEAAKRLAAAFSSEGDPAIKREKNKTGELEAQAAQLADAIAVIQADVALADAALVEARKARTGEIEAIVADFVADRFESLKASYEGLLREAALLMAASDSGGHRGFLADRGLAIDWRRPEFIEAHALVRSWRQALETDPDAKPDTTAAKALIDEEAARKAERDRQERAEEAAYRAERNAEIAKRQEENSRKEAEFLKGKPRFASTMRSF